MRTIKLRRYDDQRGNLIENTLEQIMLDSRHFFVSKSKPGVVRGNHYHHRKSEWFYIIQGQAKFCVEDIATKEREEIIVHDSDDIIINLTSDKAHAFKNTGENELILLALVNEVHNQNDPDTFPYEIYPITNN